MERDFKRDFLQESMSVLFYQSQSIGSVRYTLSRYEVNRECMIVLRSLSVDTSESLCYNPVDFRPPIIPGSCGRM